MKKTLITTALAISAVSFACAEDAAVTASAPSMPTIAVEGTPVLAPMATGDIKVDEQLRALHKEMEARIKNIRDEYQKKMKVIIGERKAFHASSTEAKKLEKKNEMATAMKVLQQEYDAKKKALQQEFEAKKRELKTASSTESARQALQQEYDAKKKAIQQEFEDKKKAIVASSTQAVRQEVEVKKAEVRQEVRGTSTNNPQGNGWGFFRRFFGQQKPATTESQ